MEAARMGAGSIGFGSKRTRQRRSAGWALGVVALVSLVAGGCAEDREGVGAPSDDGTARAQAPSATTTDGPSSDTAPATEGRSGRSLGTGGPSNTGRPASEPAHVRLPPIVEDCVVPRPAAGVRLREAIVYARPGRALMLDLALPRGEGPHPGVLLFHGGGWSAGERVHVRDEMLTLAGLGYAAASVDYRLLDDGAANRFPTQIADARCAVRYLRRRAGALGVDPDRLAAVGFSAGGHLAELLATAADVDALDGDCADTETSAAVRAAVAFYAPSDLRPEAGYGRAADRIIPRLLGASRRARPARAALASPITHVDGGDAPLLLVHGTADTVVPVDQSRRLRAALAGVGVPVQSVEIQGAPHGFRMFARGLRTRAGTCTSLSFLRAALH